MRFAGKVAVITGAAQGIGRACAERFLSEGARVVLGDVDAARLARTAAEIGSPETVLAVPTDVAKKADVDALIAAAVDRFGRIDVLANIAGRGSLGAAEEFGPDQLAEQMAVNFFGPAELTRAVLPAMRAAGSGHVLQLTSIGGLVSFGGFSAYCASKYALNGWSEALADEVRPLGWKWPRRWIG